MHDADIAAALRRLADAMKELADCRGQLATGLGAALDTMSEHVAELDRGAARIAARRRLDEARARAKAKVLARSAA